MQNGSVATTIPTIRHPVVYIRVPIRSVDELSYVVVSNMSLMKEWTAKEQRMDIKDKRA